MILLALVQMSEPVWKELVPLRLTRKQAWRFFKWIQRHLLLHLLFSSVDFLFPSFSPPLPSTFLIHRRSEFLHTINIHKHISTRRKIVSLQESDVTKPVQTWQTHTYRSSYSNMAISLEHISTPLIINNCKVRIVATQYKNYTWEYPRLCKYFWTHI